MKLWLHKIELFVDKLIVPCLILLAAILILDVGFPAFVEENHTVKISIEVLDIFIIAVFILDLTFKYIRVRSIPKFLRMYWLELIAIFPFFLVFRLFEFMFGIGEASETLRMVQSVTHEGLEFEKELPKTFQEGERLLKAERSSRFMKYLKPLLKIPRFFKTIPRMVHFFEKPTGRHHRESILDKHH